MISMPLINVQIMEGRPPEKVTELIKNLTHTVEETLNAPKESIRVIVTEVPKTHWGIAGIPASER
jgi:4-oxalocrotonate tautomerase